MFRTILVTLALSVTLLTGCHSTSCRRPACPTGPTVVGAAPVAPPCCNPTAPGGAIPAPVVPVPH